MTNPNTVDPEEIAKFDHLATSWWDKDGPLKALHDINPLRYDYIKQHVDELADLNVLDVGCGGGILCEQLARDGAHVTGIDLSQSAINTAVLHQHQSELQIDYHCISVETQAEQSPAHFDVVTCLEMLEHVPQPDHIVAACSRLVKPGGHVFFSTLNRNIKSYLQAIIGAEMILKLVPRDTHNYAKFIRPSELAQSARKAGLIIDDMMGLSYNPISRRYFLTSSLDVNYLTHCQKSQ